MPTEAPSARHPARILWGPVASTIVCTIAALLIATVVVPNRADAAPHDGATSTGMQVMLAQGPPRRAGVPGIPGLPSFGGADDERERFYDSRDEVHASVRVGARTVAQGGDLPIAIVLDIADEWKIWTNGLPLAGFARFSGETATTVTVVSADSGLNVHKGFIQWPEPKAFESDQGEGLQTYASYAGRAIIHVPVTVASDAPEGPAKILFRVGFQACDADSCSAPATVELVASVNIVAFGEPIAAEALHPDLAGFPPDLFQRIRSGERAPELLVISLLRYNVTLNVGEWFGYTLLLLVAALGGFMLNFTPCVLPVIPLKIMGLSATAGHPARCLALGASMSLGVVAFWVALGTMIATVTAFNAISQLFQYPAFTIGVGVFIILMALGMLGAFAVSLPRWVTKINPGHNSHSGSFGFGIMTAILATPCTAPLMGAAAAWAATQTPATTMQVFAAIGTGMALPYLVLAAFPKLVNKMPRTGPASDLIKQVMGLLLMAAGAYFAGAGLSGLMVTAPDPPSRVYWWAVAVAGIIAGLWLLWRTIRITPSFARRVGFGGLGLAVATISTVIGVTQTAPGPINWVYYTPDRFERALANGNVVVMDFTAEWCLNCKSLEAAVLYPKAVSSLLTEANGVVPIKVDLTGGNAAGWARLNKVGRITIPLLVVFAPDGTEVLKSELYTQGQVIEAIEAARSRGLADTATSAASGPPSDALSGARP